METFDYTLLALGGLHLPHELELGKRLAGNVPHDMPILTCPMGSSDLKALQNRRAGQCFGYGSMKVDDLRLLTFRLQLGSTQIYWLADITDAEVWKAMDKWQQQRFVPHSFLVDNGGRDRVVALSKSQIGSDAPIIGKYRNQITADAPDGVWQKMTDVAASGFIQLQATTDIPGIQLERVLVNVLVTKRYEALAQGSTFSQKPIFASAGSAGAGNVH